MNKLKQDVVALLTKREDPIKLKTILRDLGLPNSDRQYMRSLLKELVREGQVIKRGAHFWVPDGKQAALEIKREKTRRTKEVVGRISVTSVGHGYVRLEDGKEWVIPAAALGGALTGDTVRVQQRGRDSSGKPRGEVVAIESFGRNKILGIFEWYGKNLQFRPFNDISLDSRLFKNMPDQAEDGSVGVLLRQENGSWHFQKILGHIIDPHVDEIIALAENDVIAEFPEAVLKEAQEFENSYVFDPSNRRDFRDEWVFTIDGADARDFDDALHLKDLPNGNVELGIHIADVSSFVKPGSALDQWAQEKGNSTYLPHKALPMLPEILSTNLCSLNPDVPRYTLSVVAELNQVGELIDFSLHKGIICSKNRLTYSQVAAACVDKDQEVRAELGDLAEILDRLMEMTRKMRGRRLVAGALNMEMAEIRLVLDDKGLIEEARLSKQTDANRLIEACMVLANECVAHYFLRKSVDIPFRIHEKPDPEKLEQLGVFMANAGVEVPAEFFNNPGKGMNRLIEIVRDKPNGQVLQTQILKALKMAVYSPENVGHFGLASPEYSHFTSPIRRYADLVAHHRLTTLLANPEVGPEHFESAQLTHVCEHISKTERNSARAEQTFVQLKLLRLMLNELGNTFPAIVTEVKAFGLFVEIGEYRAPGLLHISELEQDYFEYNPEMVALVGKRSQKVYTVGSELNVQIIRVDLIARKLDVGLDPDDKKTKTVERRGRGPKNFSRSKGRRKTGSPIPPKAKKRRRR